MDENKNHARAQLRLLLDANVAGEMRVFGLESLAADPLFVRLAGGVVPSLDTVYRAFADSMTKPSQPWKRSCPFKRTWAI